MTHSHPLSLTIGRITNVRQVANSRYWSLECDRVKHYFVPGCGLEALENTDAEIFAFNITLSIENNNIFDRHLFCMLPPTMVDGYSVLLESNGRSGCIPKFYVFLEPKAGNVRIDSFQVGNTINIICPFISETTGELEDGIMFTFISRRITPSWDVSINAYLANANNNFNGIQGAVDIEPERPASGHHFSEIVIPVFKT